MYTVAFWFIGLIVAMVVVSAVPVTDVIVGALLGFLFSMLGVLVGKVLDDAPF